jgi:ABC-2 type transport system permease protein
VTRTLSALPTLLRVGLASALAYRAELVVWLLTTTMPLVSLALWSAVGAEHPREGLGEQELVSYFLTTFAVRQLSGCWIVWELSYSVRQGTLSGRLLRPVHPLVGFAAESLAPLPLRLLFCAPLALAFQRGDLARLAAHPTQLALFAVSIGLAWLLNFAINVILGSLAFWLESSAAFYQAYLALFMVFSGYLVPLGLLPSWARALAEWLPVRHTLAVPVELGTLSCTGAEALSAVTAQASWALALLGLGALAWRTGTARFSAVGG